MLDYSKSPVAEVVGDLCENFERRCAGVHTNHNILRIVIQQRLRLLVVDVKPVFDDCLAGVVFAVLMAASNSVHQFGLVAASEHEDGLDPQRVFEAVRLVEGAWNALEQKEILFGLIALCGDGVVHIVFPGLKREIVWDQGAGAHVFADLPPAVAIRIDVAQRVAHAGEIVTGQLAEGASNRALAGAWRANHQDGAKRVFSHESFSPCPVGPLRNGEHQGYQDQVTTFTGFPRTNASMLSTVVSRMRCTASFV